jgi:hypothetical protein
MMIENAMSSVAAQSLAVIDEHLTPNENQLSYGYWRCASNSNVQTLKTVALERSLGAE